MLCCYYELHDDVWGNQQSIACNCFVCLMMWVMLDIAINTVWGYGSDLDQETVPTVAQPITVMQIKLSVTYPRS